MEQKKRQKIIRGIILSILFVLVLIAGIRNIRFQSVESYQKEQKQTAKSLGLENRTDTVPSEQAENNEKDGTGEQEKKTAAKKGQKEKNTVETADNANTKEEGGNGQQSTKNSQSASKKSDTAQYSRQNSKDGEQKTDNGRRQANDKKTGNGIRTHEDKQEKGTGNKNTPKPEEKTQKHTDEKIQCSIEIVCASLVGNKEKLPENIQEYVPDDGIILPRTTVTVKKGISAYDVLVQVCSAKSIAIDASYTPLYKSYYLNGIAHIYEKQAGDMSGWIYQVNGNSMNVGSSDCVVEEGDTISWRYTCDGETS